VIRIRGLTLGRGPRTLLDSADAMIAPGERIALIGDNGSGKSTLLAAIAGDLSPDAGDINLPPLRIARLAQSMPRSPLPAWRFVLEADAALVRAQATLAAAESAGDGHAIAQAHDDFLACDGPSAEARARELLHGLGFDAAEQRAQRAALKKPLQKRLAEVERELARIEARIAEIDTRLGAPDGYRDAAAAAAELGRERGALQRDRDSAEEGWLELGAALEGLDAEG